jgi:molybdopterin-guanine dinucleotide biosynthesis protein A
MNLTSIILSGGKSSRMGKDKALILYLGKPLISYSIDLALNFTRNIIISSNRDEHKILGFPVVHDIYPIRAPLAGIHAGLKFSDTDWNLVLSCDMPNVSAQVVDYLLSNLDEKVNLVLPEHDGFLEPLCGFYHKSLKNIIESNIKRNLFSPLDLLKSAPNRILKMDDILKDDITSIFKNVNAGNDLL